MERLEAEDRVLHCCGVKNAASAHPKTGMTRARSRYSFRISQQVSEIRVHPWHAAPCSQRSSRLLTRVVLGADWIVGAECAEVQCVAEMELDVPRLLHEPAQRSFGVRARRVEENPVPAFR